MKNFKKIGAMILALATMFALTSTAFAAESMTGESGVIGEFTDSPSNKETSVVIYKEITAYNPETCVVNAPAITFEYTIEAGDAGIVVTDTKGSAVTKAGIGNPTITGTARGKLELVPGDDDQKLNASENGTANRFDLTVSFDGINYTPNPIPDGHTEAEYGPGIYRYKITETTEETVKNASNIKEGSGANTLYMDVYVNGAGDIYGYVLFTTDAGKVEGFVGSQPDGGTYDENDSTADKYCTFNFEVKKEVKNDNYIASTHHQFPFHITLDNPSVTASVLPIMTVSKNATQDALTAGPIGTAAEGKKATEWKPTIADGASIMYVGIPTGTTVTVYETNDVTGATYSAVSEHADKDAAGKSIFNGEDSNSAEINCGKDALATASKNHTDENAVTFVNTLINISPTGVVLRVAPYMLMLAAGILLFVVTRRRRMRTAEV